MSMPEGALPDRSGCILCDIRKLTSDDGGPAFPQDMTLRDWFAGQALSGLATESDMQRDLRDRYGQEKIYDVYAECAYKLADAMLAARQKEK